MGAPPSDSGSSQLKLTSPLLVSVTCKLRGAVGYSEEKKKRRGWGEMMAEGPMVRVTESSQVCDWCRSKKIQDGDQSKRQEK